MFVLASAFVGPDARAQEPATFVGGEVCLGCHATEAERWKGSHHALAMQKATEGTVFGDFSDPRLEHFGAVTTFSRSGEKFMVSTESPDGTSHDYEIAYTFGVYPLQQYLIAFPGGRYQALGIAWDSRPKEQGGERWFHLYPDQKLRTSDPLHWTGRDQTWNYMCADCHSTNLRKDYNLATNTYATTWTDVDVSCEACHGPGSRHVDWAKTNPRNSADPPAAGGMERMGLSIWLKPTDPGVWEMNPDTGIARRSAPLVSAELDGCAACHSRRKVITGNHPPGVRFLDAYLPAYLEPALYHADGQIDGEVYEHGSFLQSRMHAAGVTCSNCHDPHSAKLRAEGNALCAQCHMPSRFDVTEHHHHESGSTGAQCVNCHMPAKTYMVVDARRDHSIRVPRPDLSVSLSTPNACTQCHAGRPPEWAAQAVAGWFPHGRQTAPHYGTALHAGRVGAADAEQQLDRLILDEAQPAIARASALPLLLRFETSASEPALRAAIADPDPLVRSAAPRALSPIVSAATLQSAALLLRDPVRAVRIEAARALAGTDLLSLPPELQTALVNATKELVLAELVDAERPEAHLNLGLLDARRREPAEAEAEYQTALRLDPAFVPALVNLTDLDRARGMDERSAELLHKAISIEPNNADVQHALGLLLVRRHEYTEALDLLRRAHELAPDNVRYAYVYAIALTSAGAPAEAMALLEQAHRQHPTDKDLLMALVSISRDAGDLGTALRHARELVTLDPTDTRLRSLLSDLEKRQAQ